MRVEPAVEPDPAKEVLMKKKIDIRMKLHKETLRQLDALQLGSVRAGGNVTVGCPNTRTCDSCLPCTLGGSCLTVDLC
jgi:hypothetical protein